MPNLWEIVGRLEERAAEGRVSHLTPATARMLAEAIRQHVPRGQPEPTREMVEVGDDVPQTTAQARAWGWEGVVVRCFACRISRTVGWSELEVNGSTSLAKAGRRLCAISCSCGKASSLALTARRADGRVDERPIMVDGSSVRRTGRG